MKQEAPSELRSVGVVHVVELKNLLTHYERNIDFTAIFMERIV